VKLGVPRERIVKLPYYGNGTIYEALAMKRYFFKYGPARMILVTSDYHSRRVLWIFKKLFSNYQVDIAIYPAKSFSMNTKGLVFESCKLLGYWLRYGLLGLIPEIGDAQIKDAGSKLN
jgi:uncharacterized SAM-binding protein YcdF (DUF218 family)